MSTLSFYMGNPLALIDPPENWQETEIELSFEDNSPVASVKVNTFDFTNTDTPGVVGNATYINNWIAAGMFGGGGIYEGIPFQIKACDNIIIFNGVLDLEAEQNEFDCDRCTVAIKQIGAIDWLTDVADSFSFAYLASSLSITTAHSAGFIPIQNSDYILIPYVLNTIPNYGTVITLAVTELLLIKEIISATYNLTEATINLSMSAILWTTLLIFIGDCMIWIMLLIYLIALIKAFVALMKQMMDNLIQPNKYKYGMKVRTLFKKACEYLGLTFQSSILDNAPFNNLVIVPQKNAFAYNSVINNKDLPFDVGTLSFFSGGGGYRPGAYGYFDGTFGDLIRQMNEVFNAKIRITSSGSTNGILEFEVFDYWQLNTSYILPDIVEEPHKTNASELAANYYISFATDSQDLNTFNFYGGTNAQCIFIPAIAPLNQQNLLFKNLIQKNLSFALAKRKTDLTAVEKYFKNTILPLARFLSEIVGGSFPAFDFDLRIGSMLLESDFIGTQKLFIADNTGTIAANNDTNLNAISLLKNYHNHSFILDIASGINNQFYKLKNKEIPFCCANYIQILNNNYIKTSPTSNYPNTLAKVEKLLWSPEKDEARIDYDPKVQWTKNIKQQYIADGINI